MDHDVSGVPPGLTLDTFAGQILDGASHAAVAVMRGPDLLGMVGAKQVRRIRRDQWAATRAEDLMVSGDALPRVAPEMSLRDALDRLHRSGLDGLPVVEAGALTGIVTRRAVAKAVAEAARNRLRPGGASGLVSGDRLLSVEEARDAVFAAIAGPTPAEVAWLMEARGRVPAEPVTSPIALPPWDNSAMDGYAIRPADVAAATEDAPVPPRGHRRGPRRPGAGGHGPARHGGPDRHRRAGPARRRTRSSRSRRRRRSTRPVAPPGPRGRDATGPLPAGDPGPRGRPAGRLRSGAPAATSRPGPGSSTRGTVLTPAAIGLAAGVGLDQLSVHRRPIVGILATGDEVRSPGRDLGPAGIPDANGPGLVAMVEAAGGDPRVLGHRQGPPRRRQVADLRRARRGRRRADRVGRRLGRAVRRRAGRVRGLRDGRPVARRRPAGQAVRVRHGPRARPTAARTRRGPRPCCSGCPATRSRRS